MRRRLTDGLSRQRTHHLARVNLRLHVAVLDIRHQLLEQRIRQTVNENGLLRCKVVAEECVEHLVLGELGYECADARHDLLRRKIRLGCIAVGVRRDHSLQIHRRKHLVILLEAEDVLHQHVAIRQNLLDHVRRLRHLCREERVHIRRAHAVVAVHIFQRHGAELAGLCLHRDRVNSIFAVAELNDGSRHIANCTIMLHVLVLHRLHQTALDVARVGGLDCGINQTLASSLRVEEELRRQ